MASTILSDNGVSSGSAGIKTTADSTGALALQTTTVGGVATTAVTIDTSQNVGIGTSSPISKLHVNSSGSTATYAVVGNSNGGSVFGVDASGVTYVAGYASKTTVFGSYNSGGSFQETARIDTSGNLLVGTTSTSVSSGGIRLSPDNGGTGISAIVSGHITGAASGNAYSVFQYAGTTIGSISQNGTTAVAYNTSSDYRLKHDIQPMTDALAKVAALNPVTYKWNADDSDGEGFIAHELAEVCPHAVTGEKDAVETYTDEEGNEQTRPVYQGIDTSFLVATLTAAIQEQQALITTLTERITALEAK